MTRPIARATLALLVAGLVTAAGCGKSPTNPEPQPIITDPLPQNTSPQGALARFEGAFESRALAPYTALFTSNFRFAFSSQADPNLVIEFGDTWGKDDESASARHLFEGFTKAYGEYWPPASHIILTLSGTQIFADPDRPDSAAFYQRVLVPTVQLDLDMPGDYNFRISAPHDFYLVRGDAAALDAGQPADSLHWYIRRWEDRSTALVARRPGIAPTGAMPASAVTWGRIKATYYR